MTQIEKYIERLKTLQNLYEEGQPQHNAFGIAIVEANEILVKNCSIPDVVKSLPNDDEIEQAANENADRIFGDDIDSNTEWYAMQHGFTDGVEWIKNHLAK